MLHWLLDRVLTSPIQEIFLYMDPLGKQSGALQDQATHSAVGHTVLRKGEEPTNKKVSSRYGWERGTQRLNLGSSVMGSLRLPICLLSSNDLIRGKHSEWACRR
jgi:hypothetical protein